MKAEALIKSGERGLRVQVGGKFEPGSCCMVVVEHDEDRVMARPSRAREGEDAKSPGEKVTIDE